MKVRWCNRLHDVWQNICHKNSLTQTARILSFEANKNLRAFSFGIAIFVVAFLTTLLSSSILARPHNSLADTNTDSSASADGYSLTVSASSSVDLGIEVYDDDTMTVSLGNVSVVTNSPGYKLYMSMSTDDTTLSGIKSGLSGFIPAVSGSFTNPSALTSNTWGYAIPSNTTHVVSSGFDSSYATMESKVPTTSRFAIPPTQSSEPQLIAVSDSATEGDDYPVYYAVRANTAMSPGNYSNSVVFTAVADAAASETLTITPSLATVDVPTTITAKTSLYSTAGYANADLYFLTEAQFIQVSGGTAIEDLGVNPLSCVKASNVPVTYNCELPAQEEGTYYFYAKAPVYDEVYSTQFSVRKEVTLTVDPNGGTWESYTTPQIYTQNESTTKSIANPTGPTYTISYNANSTDASFTPSPASAIKDFANWTLTGGGSITGNTYTFGATSGTLTASYAASATITLPNITKTNYACHWTKDSTTGTAYNGGDTAPITANTTFYAVCTILPAITINPNGETWEGSTETQTFYQTATTTKTIADPTTSTYTITYDANGQGATYTPTVNSITPTFSSWALTGGGTWDATTSTYTFASTNGTLTASYANNTLTLPSITKTNYNCAWAKDSATGTQYNGGDNVTITANTTFYAVCTIKPSLTVNPNGGTWEGSTSSQTFYDNAGQTKPIANPTATPSYTIDYDMGTTGITKPTSPTSISRSFSSWTLAGGGSISNGTYTFGSTDGTLTATYNTTSDSFTLPAISKTGHSCKWAEGSTSGSKYDGGTSRTITGNTTYYAVCTVNQYTLTIDANGGTYSPSTVTQNYNTTYTLSNPTTTPSYTIGYDMGSTGITKPTSPTSATRTFSSWSKTSGEGSLSGSTFTFGAGNATVTASYASSATFTLPALSKSNNVCQWAAGSTSGTKYNGGTSATISANTTFYAVCTYQPLLTVNPNGGTWSGSTSSQTFRAAPNSTKTIANPSANATYTIGYNANSQGASYTGSPTSVTRNFSSWSLSGGGSISGTTYTYGTTDGTLTASYNSTSNTFTLPTITKANHTCQWAKDSASGTKYNSGASGVTITGNTTFYASCTANNYTVTITNSNTTSGSASISVPYGGSNTVTVTPASGYYLSAVSCPSGYTCTGYSTGTSYTGTQAITITNNNTQTGGTLAFTGTKLDLTSITQMQQMTSTICSNSTVGQSNTLTDARDTNTYTVKKLADGKCWMTQNLRLVGPFQPDQSDSDVTWTKSTSTFTLPAQNTGTWCTAYNDATCVNTANNLYSGDSTYGTYYSWYAATAGTGTYSTSTDGANAPSSICPKGWRLPTGGSSGEFQTLYNNYNSFALMQGDPALVLSGYRSGGSTGGQGINGYYWSSTARHASSAYLLWLRSSNVYPADFYGKYGGDTVRCIAQ